MSIEKLSGCAKAVANMLERDGTSVRVEIAQLLLEEVAAVCQLVETLKLENATLNSKERLS